MFNPAAWYDEDRKEVLLLYRTAESHPDYKCYFGLATSKDGYHFERVGDQPVLSPSVEGFDGATIQDPRLIKMGEWYYVTYAARHYPFGQFWIPEVKQRYATPDCPPEFPKYLRTNATLTGLAMTKDFRTWIRAGWLTNPLLDDRDAILFPEKVRGKFVMLHRPLEWCGEKYGTEHPCAWISMADDLMGFRESRLLIKNKYEWEAAKLGANIPPIKTPHGWLTIYHAVGKDKFYRLGSAAVGPRRSGHRAAPHARLADGAGRGLRNRGVLPGGLFSVRGRRHRRDVVCLLRRGRQVLRRGDVRSAGIGRASAEMPGVKQNTGG